MKRWIPTMLAVGLGLMARAGADDKASPGKGDILAGYVPPSLLEKAATETTTNRLKESLRWEKWEETDRNLRLRLAVRELSPGERWEKFEAEFTPRRRYDSAIQDSLSGAKYRLDKTVFALDQFIEESEKIFEVEYTFHNGSGRVSETSRVDGGRRARHRYGSAWEDIIDNMRLKTDVTLGLSDSFVGLRLDFPIGD
jgi:hypothetical protein